MLTHLRVETPWLLDVLLLKEVLLASSYTSVRHHGSTGAEFRRSLPLTGLAPCHAAVVCFSMSQFTCMLICWCAIVTGHRLCFMQLQGPVQRRCRTLRLAAAGQAKAHETVSVCGVRNVCGGETVPRSRASYSLLGWPSIHTTFNFNVFSLKVIRNIALTALASRPVE